MRTCPKCSREMGQPTPSALEQCEATELPALRYACEHCETVEWVPTGEPWRPAPWANLAPTTVGA